MAYTEPILLNPRNLGMGVGVKIVSAAVAGGAQTPFQISPTSGTYWGQVTFQPVKTSISALVATLEIDMTGVDANFVAMLTGLDMTTGLALNLNGGNIRYRLNFTTFTGTSVDIWAIAG
jgi:hypothetical protein